MTNERTYKNFTKNEILLEINTYKSRIIIIQKEIKLLKKLLKKIKNDKK